jgi:hypothetical protein
LLMREAVCRHAIEPVLDLIEGAVVFLACHSA